jgi:hypothetical protein
MVPPNSQAAIFSYSFWYSSFLLTTEYILPNSIIGEINENQTWLNNLPDQALK